MKAKWVQFQSQVAILFGGYGMSGLMPRSPCKFQSQVAILFGGYWLIRGNEMGRPCFNRRWRFFLGATVRREYSSYRLQLVSIAGGDSFWGLLRSRCRSVGPCMFQSQVAILFGGYLAKILIDHSSLRSFQSQVAILVGGYHTQPNSQCCACPFQSQVAILFGGYNVTEARKLAPALFQSQVAILFGGYITTGAHLHRKQCGFNRRWRFFLGATVMAFIAY